MEMVKRINNKKEKTMNNTIHELQYAAQIRASLRENEQERKLQKLKNYWTVTLILIAGLAVLVWVLECEIR